MNLEPPVFPERSFRRVGDRPDAVEALVRWAHGRAFHRYGNNAQDLPGYDSRVRAQVEFKTRLGFHGKLEWTVRVTQYGTGEVAWTSSGDMSVDMYADSLVSAIEAEERDRFVESLVVGLA